MFDKDLVLRRYVEGFQRLRSDNDLNLAHYFVSPDAFELLQDQSSIAVFSDPGSGQSSLISILERLDRGPSGEFEHLWVRWYPHSESNSKAPWLSRFFDLFAESIVDWISEHPEYAGNAPGWVQKSIGGFVKAAIVGDLDLRLGFVLEQSPFLQDWLSKSPTLQTVSLYPHKAIEIVCKCMMRMGLQGVYVLVDIGKHNEHLEAEAREFLSSLPLLETANVIVKGFFPMSMLSSLGGTPGVRSHRIFPLRLTWNDSKLRRIVQQRIRWVLGEEQSLERISQDPESVWSWLSLVGGHIPRVWLHQVRSIVMAFIENDYREITNEQWLALKKDNPPSLLFDHQAQVVWVGGKKIPFSDFGPQEFQVLSYLYNKPNYAVPRDEMYYCALLGLDKIPRTPDDEFYEPPKIYQGRLDTVLWRVRQVIEPDSSAPLILQTRRGQGVVLRIV